MDIDNIKKVHLIGIGGIGMSALARFFHSRKVIVSGSDEQDNIETKKLKREGVEILHEHNAKNVPSDVNLVIYSSAINSKNVEFARARDLHIITLSYTEALGRIMTSFTSVAVSGTNGKTTTTALLGSILSYAKKDPTVIVGGRVSEWDTNLLIGNSDIFVVEACEYKRNMLNLNPHIIVLTNVEEDHLDYYHDLEDIVDAFSEYVRKLHDDDLLVYNIDDKNTREVAENTTARIITFGMSETANLRAHSIAYVDGVQQFKVSAFDVEIGVFTTTLPGVYNIYNILATLAVCFDFGVSEKDMQTGVKNFNGIHRRFERVGNLNGVPIISDYAHHPTAVKALLHAVREMYGKNAKILAVFQPHQKDRTIKLFDTFVESFTDADAVILSEIYEVIGREDKKQKISSKDLVREILERGNVDDVMYAKNSKVVESLIRKRINEYDIIIIMGAGDIDDVARLLVKSKVHCNTELLSKCDD